jgi:hypothetical protein
LPQLNTFWEIGLEYGNRRSPDRCFCREIRPIPAKMAIQLLSPGIEKFGYLFGRGVEPG